MGWEICFVYCKQLSPEIHYVPADWSKHKIILTHVHILDEYTVHTVDLFS